MTKILSMTGVNIFQKNFQQLLIRGDGKDQFNQTIKKEISINPPSKNLELVNTNDYILAKNSFDQWSLIYLIEKNYIDLLNIFLI